MEWQNLGISYSRAGSRNQAQAAFRRRLLFAEKDILEDPRNGLTLTELAHLYARSGDRQRAHSEAAQALQLTPGDSAVRGTVAETYEILGERDSSLAGWSARPEPCSRG